MQHPVGADHTFRAVQRERAGQWQVVRRAADADVYLARLDDPPAGPATERDLVGMQAMSALPSVGTCSGDTARSS